MKNARFFFVFALFTLALFVNKGYAQNRDRDAPERPARERVDRERPSNERPARERVDRERASNERPAPEPSRGPAVVREPSGGGKN